MICLQISSDAKYVFLSCPRQFHEGLVVFIVYYFQIWNKKELNIIICRVISSYIGPIYIETPYTLVKNQFKPLSKPCIKRNNDKYTSPNQFRQFDILSYESICW